MDIYHFLTFFQEEHEKEEKRLQEIMEENNRKIAEAQQKLVSFWNSFDLLLFIVAQHIVHCFALHKKL